MDYLVKNKSERNNPLSNNVTRRKYRVIGEIIENGCTYFLTV